VLRILVVAVLLLASRAHAEPWSIGQLWGWDKAPDEIEHDLAFSGERLRGMGIEGKVHGWESRAKDAFLLVWYMSVPIPSDESQGSYGRQFLDTMRSDLRAMGGEGTYEEVPYERTMLVNQTLFVGRGNARVRGLVGFDSGTGNLVAAVALCVGGQICAVIDSLKLDEQFFQPLPTLPRRIGRIPYLIGHLLVMAILVGFFLTTRRDSPNPWPAWVVAKIAYVVSAVSFGIWFLTFVEPRGDADAAYSLGKATGLYHMVIWGIAFWLQRERVQKAAEGLPIAVPVEQAPVRPTPQPTRPPISTTVSRTPDSIPLDDSPLPSQAYPARSRTPSRMPSSIPLDVAVAPKLELEQAAPINPSVQSLAASQGALRSKLAYATASVAVLPAGLGGVREDGSRHSVQWSAICGVVARRLPANAPYDGITFVDVVSTEGATLRILPWTEVTGENLLGSPDERARAIVQLVAMRCPEAQLDTATRAFLGRRGPAVQIPDLATLAEHDRRLA
jgi:hypothetical protein